MNLFEMFKAALKKTIAAPVMISGDHWRKQKKEMVKVKGKRFVG